jgi:hypothetical protein
MSTTIENKPAATAEAPSVGVAAGASGSGLWVVACVLVKHTPTGLSFSQSVSWRKNATKDEATGAAVNYALENKPGFAVEMVTAVQLDAPNTEVSNSGPKN